MVKCSKCGNEAEGTAEHGEHLKAHKHLPAHSQPEHTRVYGISGPTNDGDRKKTGQIGRKIAL